MARSADPFEKAVITPNYLSDPADFQVMKAGVGFTRAIFAAPAIAQHSVWRHCPGRISPPTMGCWTMPGGSARRSITR